MGEPGTARCYKPFARDRLLAMTAFAHVWFADILINGMVCFAVCLVVYLMRMEFRQKWQRRKDQRERRRQRRDHWGYEP